MPNVLFLCTGNSARSIIAEAVANQPAITSGKLHAYSAGSHPKGAVHPLALEVLRTNGFPTDGLESKGWDVFSGPDAPHMDLIVTVCDQAAAEECPVWPGHPSTAHWGVPDPAAAVGSPDDRRRAFIRTYQELRRRVELLAALPLETLSRLALQEEARQIGGRQTEPR